jgi:hypothetical protein
MNICYKEVYGKPTLKTTQRVVPPNSNLIQIQIIWQITGDVIITGNIKITSIFKNSPIQLGRTAGKT